MSGGLRPPAAPPPPIPPPPGLAALFFWRPAGRFFALVLCRPHCPRVLVQVFLPVRAGRAARPSLAARGPVCVAPPGFPRSRLPGFSSRCFGGSFAAARNGKQRKQWKLFLRSMAAWAILDKMGARPRPWPAMRHPAPPLSSHRARTNCSSRENASAITNRRAVRAYRGPIPL